MYIKKFCQWLAFIKSFSYYCVIKFKVIMENYEEKYKKLVERAREAKESTTDEGFLKWIEDNFSELRESEDEKIMTHIISIVKQYGEICKKEGDECPVINECLAWLEKLKNIVDEYEDKLDRCACKNFDKGYKACLEAQPMQEWSEEDEMHWKNCLAFFKGVQESSPYYQDYVWLKSLRSQTLCIPNAEQNKQDDKWSEEDEKMFNSIIKHFEREKEHGLIGTFTKTPDDIIFWLKNLRPHTPLKPTEKEIDEAANKWNRRASFSPIAMTLDSKGNPNGTKRFTTSHTDSFKAGVEWLWNKIQGK